MKRWLRWIGMTAAIAGSAIFIGYLLTTLDLGSLRAHLNSRSLLALAAAVLLYAAIVPLGALAWRIMLRDMGHRERFLPLLAIMSVTQAGKYLPGNVGQHVGRIGLSLAHGIPAAILIASMAYEVCLLLLADLFTAVAAGAASGPGLEILLGTTGHASAIAIAVAATLLCLAAIPVLTKVLPRLTGWLMSRRGGGPAPAALTLPAIGQVLGLYVAAMLCVGASMAVLALGLFPGRPFDFALLTAAFTLAWAIGFITPGAPAGLGVREALLLLMLAHGMGAANASLLILALRVATTLGDMLCFIVGLALLPMSRVGKWSRVGDRSSTLPAQGIDTRNDR